MGLVAAVIVIPLVVSMVMGEHVLRELTIKMLDTFISVFLAILWFNTFRTFIKVTGLGTLFPYAHEIFSFVQIIMLYMIANVVAYMWQDDAMRLTTFCSCGAHFIAFAGINFAAESQHTAAQQAGPAYDDLCVWGLVLTTAVFLMLMFTMNYLCWRRDDETKELRSALDELELDVMGLVLSFVITQSIRHALTGIYPALHFLQVDGGPSKRHMFWQRAFMFMWTASLVVVAGVLLPRLNDWVQNTRKPWVQNLVHISKVVLIMLIAWGFLLWGEWEFHEHLFVGSLMFGHMCFAMIATLVCLMVLYLRATFGERVMSPEARETNAIMTTGISLVAAWSWEHCFNLAFDIIGSKYQVGFDGLVPKLILSIVVPACLLPVYLTYVRKEVLEIEEFHESQGHGGMQRMNTWPWVAAVKNARGRSSTNLTDGDAPSQTRKDSIPEEDEEGDGDYKQAASGSGVSPGVK